MADADAWAALPRRDREEKERFLRGQERAAKGFMRNATRTLALLNLLASSETVAPAFVRSDVVAGRAAYAVVRASPPALVNVDAVAAQGSGPGDESDDKSLASSPPGVVGWAEDPSLVRETRDETFSLSG